MADGGWYVSWQGKVQGPLPWSTIQELARLGRLKPGMQLSRDRSIWTPASRWSDLFAPAPSPPPPAPPRKPPSKPVIPAVAPFAMRSRTSSRGGPWTVLCVTAVIAVALIIWFARFRGSGRPGDLHAEGERPPGITQDEYNERLATLRKRADDELENERERLADQIENQLDKLKAAVFGGELEDYQWRETVESIALHGGGDDRAEDIRSLSRLFSRQAMRKEAKAVADLVEKVERPQASIKERYAQEIASLRQERSYGLLNEGHKLELGGDLPGALAKYSSANSLHSSPHSQGACARVAKALKEVHSQTIEKLLGEARSAESRKDFDAAIAKYSSILVLQDDPAVRVSLEQAQASLDALQADSRFEALVVEAKSLGESGDLGSSLARYDEALSVKDDASARSARDAMQARINEETLQEKEAQEAAARATAEENAAKELAAKRARIEALLAEAAEFERKGAYDVAFTRLDEAFRLEPDPAVREQRNRVQSRIRAATLAKQFECVPTLSDVPQEACLAAEVLAPVFWELWGRRDSPATNLADSKKLMIRADATYDALPSELKDQPALLFLSGAVHFLVARGISDEWQARIDSERSAKRKEALLAQFKPLYKKELAIAQDCLERCRKACPDHYATCLFEDLARAWGWVLDQAVGVAGRKDLRADTASKTKATAFDVELEAYASELGKSK